jgi:ParB family chromosome partitioning protein
MGHNHFNNLLDWTTQGKYVRAYASNAVYEGWVADTHKNKNSIILHGAKEVSRDHDRDVGSVFLRTCNTIEVLKPQKKIEFVDLDAVEQYPGYDIDFEPGQDMVRRLYRNRSAGSFPVVTADKKIIINGHKRIAAAKLAGLERHAVEVIDVTPREAQELFELAHPGHDDTNDTTSDTEAPRPATGGQRLNTPARSYHQQNHTALMSDPSTEDRGSPL